MNQLVVEVDQVPGQDERTLAALASKKFHSELVLVQILKKSIDARKKDHVVVRYRLVVGASEKDRSRLLQKGATPWQPEAADRTPAAKTRGRTIVIVGGGPAGLMCALRLQEAGIRSTVLEQGRPVAERHRDIERLRTTGVLDPESNVVFGEGGAGTYSDGKLTTRIHKPGISWVFDRLVEHGAPANIAYDAKPHVGTDVLSRVVTSIRERLEAGGTKVLFGRRVVGLLRHHGRIAGVTTADGAEVLADAVVLACGHSARGLYEMLAAEGVTLERKGFAVGIRVEHPADFIGRSQFGPWAAKLPAADYRLTFNNPQTGRGTYTFCMCPGGEVVNSSSEPGLLCVNGMSYSQRDLPRSNAALVTSITANDGPPGILGGLAFQRELERAAFLAGGGEQRAPACSVRGFLEGRPELLLPSTSYEPRVTPSDPATWLPPFVTSELRLALTDWDRRIPGFIDQGTLIGAETRTSSPVRIVRGEDFQSPGLPGLYPAGEGAGYAGGIISSAVDGVRIADALGGA